MNEQNEFIKNYLHTEYVGCLKTDHEKYKAQWLGTV